MKKYFYTMAVIAVFAIGFAASGDSEGDSEEVYYSNGKEFHKKHYTCSNCGDSPEYAWRWVSTDGNSRIDPYNLSGNFYEGKFYCSKCIDEAEEKIKRRRGW